MESPALLGPQPDISTTTSRPLMLARNNMEGDQPQEIIYTLNVLSLTFASLSVMMTLSTMYWFVKMRRSFRHELIMLLIQSDFVKSAAFVLFPIVNMVRGTVRSDSLFCQFSGFALSFGIESADIAVLLIAVHSVMYIFRPRSGLYPYRHVAYMVFYLFPLTTACLAFLDGTGYENVGHYCYLRTDTAWPRLALSWGPRYVICLSIVIMYAFIYFYIRKRMDDYGRRSSGNIQHTRPATAYHDVPPTPRIAYHGLIPSSPNSRRSSAAEAAEAAEAGKSDRQRSISSISTLRLGSLGGTGSVPTSILSPKGRAFQEHKRSIQWNWTAFQQAESSVGSASSAVATVIDEPGDPLSPEPTPFLSTPISPPPAVHSPWTPRRSSASAAVVSNRASDESSQATTASSFYQRSIPSNCASHRSGTHPRLSTTALNPGAVDRPDRRRALSLPNLITMLRYGPDVAANHARPRQLRLETGNNNGSSSDDGPRGNISPIVMSPGTFEDTNATNQRNRDKVRRQLRSLLAYPLVYMAAWFFPFISHVMGYDDAVRGDDPRWLLIVGIISLCVQGAADSTLFAVREQPWRYDRGRRFTEVLKRRAAVRLLWWRGKGGATWRDAARGGHYGAGRTREEVLADGRLARERREEEQREEERRRADGGRRAAVVGSREWWDVHEVDGAEEMGDDESYRDDYDDDEIAWPGRAGQQGSEEV